MSSVIDAVIYIRAPIQQVWQALTDPRITVRYWCDTRIESSWQVGDKIRYIRLGEVTEEHTLLAISAPEVMHYRFQPLHGAFRDELPSQVTIRLTAGQPGGRGEVVRVAVHHDGFPEQSRVYAACAEGWPWILSNLKSWIETGKALPDSDFAPYA